MDPVAGGAIKGVQQNIFQEAQETVQKANDQVSDFEKLRQKLEQQDAISNPQQVDQAQQTNQVQQTNQIEGISEIQKSSEVQMQQVPEIKDMDQLESMVSNIRSGQERLNQIISDATSGKTYSPTELIAIQAEVGKITQELEMASKVVQHFVEGVKTTLNIQV